MLSSATRHFLITIFIVSVIYAALLWINGISPLTYDASTKNHSRGSNIPAVQNAHERTNTTNAVNTTVNLKSSQTSTQVQQENQTITTPPIDNSFAEFSITGISTRVQLDNPKLMQQQVEGAWQDFVDHDALHESVNWIRSSNEVYAYYHDFNKNFTSVSLIVGYMSGSPVAGLLPVTAKAGVYKHFAFNSAGATPDEAWEYAYPNGTLVESASGDPKLP